VGVNTASRASTVDVDLDPPDGNADVILQIGPVIKDTGVRDALEFISFTDFTNQLEFARLSNAFNKKVNAAVLSGLDRENLMGKRIAFHGVFTQLQDSDLVRITPVVLEVK
jgi:predicted lipoprotein